MTPQPTYIEKAIFAVLAASSAVRSICGDRIYQLKIPQGESLPALVYQRINTSPNHTLRGYGSEYVSIMINSFAPLYGVAKELSLAVRFALAEYPIHAILRNETDLYKENAEVFCISAEYLCQQEGGFTYDQE